MNDAAMPAALIEAVTKLRREIHQQPDLSHDETPTAGRVRKFLESYGVEDIRPIPGTAGLIVTLGRGGRETLVIKADLDALPMEEDTGLPFASQKKGVMHACGHDVHTAILAGLAVLLQAQMPRLPGEVRLVFQPAEEKEPLGARAVVAAGLLSGATVALGFHVDPELPVGVIGGLAPGVRSAYCDEIRIVVHGCAAHAARPHLGIDAIALGAALVQEAQKVSSRLNSPLEPIALTFGRIAGGTMPNSLADRVVIDGTLRTTRPEQREHARQALERLCDGLGAAYLAKIELVITPGEPAMINDARILQLAQGVALGLVGPARITPEPAMSLGGDDFAFYLEKVPGVMVRLGTRNEALQCIYPLHHPRFCVDEAVIPLGLRYLSRLIREVVEGSTRTNRVEV